MMRNFSLLFVVYQRFLAILKLLILALCNKHMLSMLLQNIFSVTKLQDFFSIPVLQLLIFMLVISNTLQRMQLIA